MTGTHILRLTIQVIAESSLGVLVSQYTVHHSLERYAIKRAVPSGCENLQPHENRRTASPTTQQQLEQTSCCRPDRWLKLDTPWAIDESRVPGRPMRSGSETGSEARTWTAPRPAATPASQAEAFTINPVHLLTKESLILGNHPRENNFTLLFLFTC